MWVAESACRHNFDLSKMTHEAGQGNIARLLREGEITVHSFGAGGIVVWGHHQQGLNYQLVHELAKKEETKLCFFKTNEGRLFMVLNFPECRSGVSLSKNFPAVSTRDIPIEVSPGYNLITDFE